MTGTSQPTPEADPPTALRRTKSALRTRLRAARRALEPAYVDACGVQLTRLLLTLPEVQHAAVVAAYASIGKEPATRALLDALHGAGKRVLLPITRPDLDLEWAEYAGPESLQPSARGLPEPTTASMGLEAIAQADVVLAPAQAVSPGGRRLGQGGGCYDRALARLRPSTPVLALVYDDELVAELPSEPHDRPVTAAVTPTQVFRFSGD